MMIFEKHGVFMGSTEKNKKDGGFHQVHRLFATKLEVARNKLKTVDR